MVLCVKPTAQDFDENNMAMEFGVLTQDVAVDYASPAKMAKRSKSRTQEEYAIMYEFLGKRLSQYKPNPNVSDEQFIEDWVEKLKSNRDARKKYMDTSLAAQAEVRQKILRTFNEITSMAQLNDKMSEDMRNQEAQVAQLEDSKQDALKCSERALKQIEQSKNEKQRLINELQAARKLLQKVSHHKDQYEKLCRDSVNIMDHKSKTEKDELIERIMQLQGTAPSAPTQSSSPINRPNPSTYETTETGTPLTTTCSSSEPVEFQEHRDNRPFVSISPLKNLLASPNNGGVPVVNPRHNRSLSCSSMQWIHHKPAGTLDMGTVLKPKLKNGRSVKNLRSSDILRKDAAGYSVVHQDADANGDVETSVYKGHIVSTVCGGAQVILNDVETMRQVSPKRKRVSKDAHYTQ